MLKRLTSLLLALAMVLTMLPVSALAEETQTNETAVAETTAPKAEAEQEVTAVSEDTAAQQDDRAAADAVTALIEALPSLEEICSGSNEERQAAYAQVQSAYSAYEALTDAQKALLPPAEEVFGPYFDYFNSLTQETGTLASGEDNGGKITWVLDDAGTLTITGTGSMNIWGSTSSPWYDYRDAIKKVVIGSGITKIRSYQFYGCTNMTSISIPETVTEISSSAFQNCSSLSSITLPSGITEINSSTFRNCQSLTKIVIPSGVTTISDNAFNWCTSLTSVTIPSTVTSIGAYAFFSCSDLASITIPSGVTEIGTYTFGGCGSMTSVSIPSTVTTIGDHAFYDCSSLKSLTLPASLKSIGEYAFLDCTSLSSVSLPSSLETIESGAFEGCTALTSVTIPKKVTILGSNPFRFCSKLSKISVGSGNTSYRVDSSGALYSYDYSRLVTFLNTKTGSYTVNSQTSTIGYGAFGATQLTTIQLPASVTTIEDAAFSRSVNLTTISIPSGVTSLGRSTFYNCTKLENLVIPDGVTTLGEYVFFFCTGLTSITLPASLTSVDNDAFGYNTSLTDVYFGGTEEVWNTYKLSTDSEYRLHPNCTSSDDHWFIKTVAGTCTTVGYTCDSCACGYEINIVETGSGTGGHDWQKATCQTPKTCRVCGVTEGEPGSHSFENNKCIFCGLIGGTCGANLSWRLDDTGTLTISGTGAMEDYAMGAAPWFANQSDIRAVVIEDGVTKIGDHAFFGCEELTSVTIPDSVTEIGASAFENCGSLEHITIPSGVTNIEDGAFDGCDSLTDVYYDGTLEEWADLGNSVPGTVFIHYVCTNPADTWKAVSVAVTCESDGYTCERCACGYERNKVVTQYAPGHDMGQWVTISEATCTEDGIQQRDCSRCDHSETKVIEAAGHAYEVVVTLPTCTEGGYTTHTCHCGDSYVDNYSDALGHSEVIDEAVSPTCSESGLTEGKHCSVCGETLVAQKVIPATGHSFEAEETQIICSICSEPLILRIYQDYIVLDLSVDSSAQLDMEISPAEFAETIQWSIEGDEGVVTVDQTGTVTALAEGTAYVVAEVSAGEFKTTARCRVDVAEAIALNGVQLGTTKLTTELFRTDYAEFELLLQLPQNLSIQSLDGEYMPDSYSVAIDGVYFAASDAKDAFDLVALDDRRIAVVPTEYAVNNPGELAKAYKSAVTVIVQGGKYTTDEELTLTVKQTKPKLKASAAAFNSFYTCDANDIVITGGTPTVIRENTAKNTKKTRALPTWLTLADGVLTLTKDAPLKNVSAKAYLLVETEEWRIPAPVTLTVKNTYKAPGLKLSASTVTVSSIAENSAGVSLKLLCKSKTDTLEKWNVTGISAPNGYFVENFDTESGSFTLKAKNGFMAGTVTLQVHFGDTAVTLPLKLTVKTLAVTLKPSIKTLTLNSVKDSAVVTLSATPADYRISGQTVRLTTSKGVNKLESGELKIRNENGRIEIETTDLTPEKETYKLYVSANGSKETVITINVVSSVPSVTFRASGSMDLSFPDQEAVIIPSVRNCSGNVASYEYTVAELKGTTIVNADVTHAFRLEQDGANFRIRFTDEKAINTTSIYAVKLKLILTNGSSVENVVKLKVKRTAVKLKLASAKLILNSTFDDKASIAVTCTTKGYAFTRPIWELMDKSGKTPAGDKLDITWSDGKLNIAVNEKTEPGATYKLLVKANEHTPAATLTITIPTTANSAIKSNLKAKGSIDVIRAGTAVTLTPSYKNCNAAGKETLSVYSSADSYTDPVNHLFNIEKDDQGRYILTAGEGLDHSKTYKAKLVTEFEGMKPVETGLVKFTVKMGSAKLTLTAQSNVLFGRDKNSRVNFTLTAKEAALNEVAEITIKSDKNKFDEKLEIIPYGSGEFAIGFKDESVHSSLIGRTITVTLNIRLIGNETAKVNTTAKLKLTVRK